MIMLEPHICGMIGKRSANLAKHMAFLAIADINFRIQFLSVIKRVSTKIENLILTYSFPTGSEMCFSIRILLLFSFCMSRYGTERQHIYIYIVSA